MGRRRATDDGLPERVYAHRKGFIYRPPEGKAVMLGSTVLEALAEYSRLTGEGAILPAQAAAPRLTISHLVGHLLANHLPTLAPDTRDRYEPYLLLIQAALGDLPPAAVKPRDIYAFMDGVTDSAGSRNVILTQFRNIFKLAIRKGACDVNPARDVSRDPTPGRDRIPTFEELEVFKEEGGAWWGCYIDFKLMTGLRERDLITLPPIALTAPEFTVIPSKSRRWRKKEQARVGREVPYVVDEELRGVLRRLYALDRPQSTKALFCSEHGRPYRSSGFQNAWRQVMVRTAARGVAWFHEHDIRATVATVDPENAQARLGHKNRTTTDIYLRKFAGTKVAPLSLKTVQERGKGAEIAKSIHQLPKQNVK